MGGIGNADVNNPLYTSFSGSIDEHCRILDCLVEGHLPTGKSHPVGVVQCDSSPQALDQQAPVVKIERENLHTPTEGVRPVGMAGEGSNPFPQGQKAACYVFAGVAEGTSHNIQIRSFRGHDAPFDTAALRSTSYPV